MIMDFINKVINEFGTTILLAIASYIGIAAKRLYKKYINDETKRAVAKTCVKAVEQIYTDLHGEDKYNMAAKSISQTLTEKGIKITDVELKMLIEAAVGEFNRVFESK